MLAGGVKNLDSTTLGFPVGAEMGLRHVMAVDKQNSMLSSYHQ